jgi:hypothetical protein
MAYYPRQLDLEGVICDPCGEARWPSHPHYDTNTDTRIAEADSTGVLWCWVPIYSHTPSPCVMCGTPTK